MRPGYHLSSPEHWLNDPIPFYWDDTYHLFFQYSDDRDWKIRQWQHAVSQDLINWEIIEPALLPEQSYDKMGCWTGSIVEKDQLFYLFYTGVSPQVQCLATSRDLIHWKKQGVIIEKPPEGFDHLWDDPDHLRPKICWRDPCVWFEDGQWLMIIGSEDINKGGAALLYASDNLRDWRYLHPFYTGDREQIGYMFECPDYFTLDGHDILLSCCCDHQGVNWEAYWYLGQKRNQKFIQSKQALLDRDAFYAPKTTRDKKGRRLLWGWIPDTLPFDMIKEKDHAGVLSLPRRLSVKDGQLMQTPVEELQQLRLDAYTQSNMMTNIVISDLPTHSCEINLDIQHPQSKELLITLFYSITQQKGFDLKFDLEAQTLNGRKMESITFPLNIKIFTDISVIECFINECEAQTHRYYPPDDSFQFLSIISSHSQVIEKVQIYPLKAVEISSLL